MKTPIFALVAAGAAFSGGCGAEDYESEAAYPSAAPPPAIGSTPSEVAPTPPYYAPAAPPPLQAASAAAAPVDGEPPPSAEAGYGPEDPYADQDPSALTDFHAALDPYGNWIDDPTYGTTWVPSPDVVGADFTPYVSAGHWTYDDEYTWVSDYDWGWAPFHYGRWAYASRWMWIPGRAYAGGWVSWRYGVGDWPYVGWAPLGPSWGWRGGAVFGLGYPGPAPYGFCASRDLFAPQVGPRMLTGSLVGTVGPHTRPYAAASPGVNGRIRANPSVNGPSPALLNIPASSIAHGASTNRGVLQARAFAHASTATALGARPPQMSVSRSGRGEEVGRSPAYGRPAPSHFGGKFGYGFSGSINNQGPTYSPGSRPYYGAAAGSRGSFGGSTRGAAFGGSAHGAAFGGSAHGEPFGGSAHGANSGSPAVHATAVPAGSGGGHRGYSAEGGGGSHGGGHGGGGGGGGGRGGGHR